VFQYLADVAEDFGVENYVVMCDEKRPLQ